MSIRLSNTGGVVRLAKSSFSMYGDRIEIEHYVSHSGILAPAFYNFRNQRPALVEGVLPKTAQIGAKVDDVMYYASINVHLDKFSGMDIKVSFALVVPNNDYRIGVVETVPLKSLVPDCDNTVKVIEQQVREVFREWSEGESYWVCLNNWLKERGHLESSEEE